VVWSSGVISAWEHIDPEMDDPCGRFLNLK
jgi:hypothetical protein